MWWCASGYVVVAHEILVSAQGPFLGFWVWGLGVWGLGLTIYNVKLRQAQILFTELSNIKDKSFAGCCEIAVKAA